MDHDSNGPAGVPILTTAHPQRSQPPQAQVPAQPPQALQPPPLVDAFVRRVVLEPTGSGALDGMTFAVKDVFDVAGHPTACGNPSWRATHPWAARHADVVRRLLAAGARLEGKTRTDELAYSLDGWNGHEGAPVNPAAPTRLTGGSSSGAASALAAGAVDIAIGTDTAGSVRVPAAWCGVLGFRPTHARVCTDGLTPLAPDFDTVGWMARSGSVLRAVGTVLLDRDGDGDGDDDEGGDAPRAASAWLHDPALDARGHPACAPPCSATAATAATTATAATAATTAARRFEAVCPGLEARDLGIDFGRAADCLRVLQGAAAWRTHGAWIEATRPQFGPGVAERFQSASRIDQAQVRQAERERTALLARLDAALPRGRLLCLPTVPGPAPLRTADWGELQRQRALLLPLTALASLSGRPQISLPLQRADGAPLGLSLLGWRGGDAALLQIAAAICP